MTLYRREIQLLQYNIMIYVQCSRTTLQWYGYRLIILLISCTLYTHTNLPKANRSFGNLYYFNVEFSLNIILSRNARNNN